MDQDELDNVNAGLQLMGTVPDAVGDVEQDEAWVILYREGETTGVWTTDDGHVMLFTQAEHVQHVFDQQSPEDRKYLSAAPVVMVVPEMPADESEEAPEHAS